MNEWTTNEWTRIEWTRNERTMKESTKNEWTTNEWTTNEWTRNEGTMKESTKNGWTMYKIKLTTALLFLYVFFRFESLCEVCESSNIHHPQYIRSVSAKVCVVCVHVVYRCYSRGWGSKSTDLMDVALL